MASVREGSIPMTEDEWKEVNKIIDSNPNKTITYMRRDPYNQGPIIVRVGDKTIEL